MSVNPQDRMILAVDVSTIDEAVRLVEQMAGRVGAFKVGLELVNACGPQIFERLRQAGAQRIFYDCKLHDIPNTVAGALRSIGQHNLWMVNLHAAGGVAMMEAGAQALQHAASESGTPAPHLIAVTLLTSISKAELTTQLHVPLSPVEYVTAMALSAKQSGLSGVVASPHEISAVRAACGPDFLIVTPGVRPVGVDAGDQRRVMTPGEAVRLGADYLVVGRAITADPDPLAAAARIAEEIAEAVSA